MDNSSDYRRIKRAKSRAASIRPQGLSGFALSRVDVGGFAGTPEGDLLAKWFEIASFQPIDRDHTEKGTGDQEPWVGGAEPEAIRRRFSKSAIG